MRAAILTGYNEPLVDRGGHARRRSGPRDVVVHIDASGVCHSDLSVANGTCRCRRRSSSATRAPAPCSRSGTEVSRVAGRRPCDRVVRPRVRQLLLLPARPVAALRAVDGRTMVRPKGTRADGSAVIGMTGLGTFADEMTVDEAMLVKVETDLPDEQLALIGCGVTTGVGAALNTAKVAARRHRRGDRLRRRRPVGHPGRAHRGRVAHHRRRPGGAEAQDRGAVRRHRPRRPGRRRPGRAGEGATGGRGADYAFEVIGLPETILQAYDVARRGGTAVVVGMARFDAQVTFPAMSALRRREAAARLHVRLGAGAARLPALRASWSRPAGSTSARWSRGTSTLDEVNDAFRAMEAGEVIRSVIT